MNNINQPMDTVDAKWEVASAESSTEEIYAINEIFRNQFTALREINNALGNEIYNSLLDGQGLAESENEWIEPSIAIDEKSVDETNQRFDPVETNRRFVAESAATSA